MTCLDRSLYIINVLKFYSSLEETTATLMLKELVLAVAGSIP